MCGREAQGRSRTCRWTGVTSSPMVDDERSAALAAVADPRAAQLRATVAELELVSRFDRGGAEQRAEEARATARDLGLPGLEQRAELVRAEMLRRRGHM